MRSRATVVSVLLFVVTPLLPACTASGGPSTASTVHSPLPPASPTAWNVTASTSVARASHAATLLPDGRALVIGGDDRVPTMTVETYSPVTNRWTRLRGTIPARYGYSIFTLPSGKVLVAGGQDGSFESLASTYLYDPSTETFAGGGALAAERSAAVLTQLADGRVVSTGGRLDPGSDLSSTNVEIYDAATNAWSPGASMIAPRANHAAVVLADGRLLVVGGSHRSVDVATAEIYDPDVDAWAAAASMSGPRVSPLITFLPAGQVLVVGGSRSSSALRTAELYDPDAGTWSSAGWPTESPFAGTLTVLPNGGVLLVGSLRVPQVYDPSTDAWSNTSLPSGKSRFAHTATLLRDGRVLLAAGVVTTGIVSGASTSVETFASLRSGTPCSLEGDCASFSCSGVCD